MVTSLHAWNPSISLSIAIPLIITDNKAYNPMFTPKIIAPNKVTIKCNNVDNSNINIESNLPISKNLSIDGYKSEVNLNLPLDRYKFKFDVKAYENIDLNEFLQGDLENEKDYDLKEFKKTINKDLENEYKVNIQATNVYFN